MDQSLETIPYRKETFFLGCLAAFQIKGMVSNADWKTLGKEKERTNQMIEKKKTFTEFLLSEKESKNDSLVEEFIKTRSPREISFYSKRDNCGPAALDFISWAKTEKGISLKRVKGTFLADKVVSEKEDFTPRNEKGIQRCWTGF